MIALALRLGRIGIFAASLLAAGPASAQTQTQTQTPIKFSLDFKFEGPAAPFVVAIDKGYFKAEGLDVTIDTASGSLEPINRVASGTYDMGFGDINSLIKFRDANPGTPIKAVFMVYNKPPFSIVGRKSRGVAAPKDLEGMKLRIWESKTAIETWRGLGANTIVVPRPEMYLAFKQGIIEGGPETIGIAYDQKNAEVAKFWTRTDEYYQIVNVLMNERKYMSLSPQQREILHKAAKAGGAAYAAESERGFTEKKQKAMKEFGVTVLEPDLAPWRERGEQVVVKLEAEGVIPKGLAAKAKALK